MRYLITLLFVFCINLTYAKYKQKCHVRYMTDDGWSKKYTVDVTFVSGYELNEATSSFRYSSYSVYAIIFWGEGQASVIKLSSYTTCGTEVDKNCIASSLTDLKGTDQKDDEWKICVSNYCY